MNYDIEFMKEKAQLKVEANKLLNDMQTRQIENIEALRLRKAFYNSKEWQRAREKALMRDRCIDVWHYLITGEIKAGNIVHHIESLSDNFDKRADISNLVTLSSESHGLIEDAYKDPDLKVRIQKMLREAVMNLDYLLETNEESSIAYGAEGYGDAI